MMKLPIAALLVISTGSLIAAPTGGSTCDSLSRLNLPNVTVNSAQSVAAGAFTPPAAPGPFQLSPKLFKDLPEFCRIMATLAPSSDSDIKIELWLPASGWNNDFQAIGNGGWNGTIGYGPLAEGVKRGFATAATDTGHAGASASFAMGHPEKLTDFAYRAVHEMTVTSKAIIQSFYGTAPRYSYWNGCSTGGRQGLKEAQKFPADFDGIIAGAPANYQTHLHVWSIWVAQQMNKKPDSYLPPAKLAVLHQAVLAACDAEDGVKDGLLNDPTKCHFDPKSIECKGADSATCLTSAQVAAVQAIYAGPKNAAGKQVFPSFEPGSELGWNLLAGQQAASVASDSFTYVVYKNPQWDWKTMNLDSDVAQIEKTYGSLIDATDPNLKPFFAHKGKLLMYHGWSDQAIAPLNSVNYYSSVVKNLGGEAKASDDIRLFMVPAMAHCGGGEGPNDFDKMTAIQQWVEQGKAPETMIASHTDRSGTVDRTRPLCRYPRVARYKGTGSTDEAANFTCGLP
jgi:Tannase and feruloyl esterase